MEIHIDAIKRDLAGVIAALGDEAVAEQWRRLADAVEPSLRLRLIDLLSEAALSLNGQLTAGTSRCASQDATPSSSSSTSRPRPTSRRRPATISAPASRCASPRASRPGSRSAAAREGVSTNAWIVRALARALEPRAARRSSNRLQGFARS